MEKGENIVIFYYLVGVNRKREKKWLEYLNKMGWKLTFKIKLQNYVSTFLSSTFLSFTFIVSVCLDMAYFC